MSYVIILGNGTDLITAFKLTKQEAQDCINNVPGCAVNLDPSKYLNGSNLSSGPQYLCISGKAFNGWYILKGDPAVLVPSAYTVE